MSGEESRISERCICCNGGANFTVQLILSSRGTSPRRQHGSKVIGVCDTCCSPSSPGYATLKTLLMTELWMNRNTHARKLEMVPMDMKTAAAGE